MYFTFDNMLNKSTKLGNRQFSENQRKYLSDKRIDWRVCVLYKSDIYLKNITGINYNI